MINYKLYLSAECLWTHCCAVIVVVVGSVPYTTIFPTAQYFFKSEKKTPRNFIKHLACWSSITQNHLSFHKKNKLKGLWSRVKVNSTLGQWAYIIEQGHI